MSKHTHHESKAEQRLKKENGTPPFHFDPYQTSEVDKLEDISRKVSEYDGDLKLRAYQIHLEKGGSDFDNWLEAERKYKNV